MGLMVCSRTGMHSLTCDAKGDAVVVTPPNGNLHFVVMVKVTI
jgi:hypothetical protein